MIEFATITQSCFFVCNSKPLHYFLLIKNGPIEACKTTISHSHRGGAIREGHLMNSNRLVIEVLSFVGGAICMSEKAKTFHQAVFISSNKRVAHPGTHDSKARLSTVSPLALGTEEINNRRSMADWQYNNCRRSTMSAVTVLETGKIFKH